LMVSCPVGLDDIILAAVGRSGIRALPLTDAS